MLLVSEPVKDKIKCVVKDKHALRKYIKEQIDNIVPSDLFLAPDNNELLIVIVKRLIVKAIDSSFKLEDNRGYIVELMLDNDLYRFSVSYVDNEKVGKGYTIALTLQ